MLALAVMIPRINEGKDQRAARAARRQARNAAAKNRARIIRAPAPRPGEAAALLPAAGALGRRA